MKETIILIAETVYKELGPGHVENVYQSAMAIEFRRRGIEYLQEQYIPVLYLGEQVGYKKMDFVVKGIIVELKVNSVITEPNKAQAMAYINSTSYEKAIIISFKKEGILTFDLK